MTTVDEATSSFSLRIHIGRTWHWTINDEMNKHRELHIWCCHVHNVKFSNLKNEAVTHKQQNQNQRKIGEDSWLVFRAGIVTATII